MSILKPALSEILDNHFFIQNVTSTSVKLEERNCEKPYHLYMDFDSGLISYLKLPEDGRPILRLFKETRIPINRRCDYVVFREELARKRLWIYYVELKKSLQKCPMEQSESEFDLLISKNQLIPSYCLVHYVFNLLKHLFRNRQYDITSYFSVILEQFVCFNLSYQTPFETSKNSFNQYIKPYAVIDWICEDHNISFYRFKEDGDRIKL